LYRRRTGAPRKADWRKFVGGRFGTC